MSRYVPPTPTNTRPEQIVDKNGVITTRNKRIDTATSVNRAGSAPAPSLAGYANRPLASHAPSEVDIPLSENYFQQSRVMSEISMIKNTIRNYGEIIDSEIAKTKRAYERLTAEGELERAAHFADPENSYNVKNYRDAVAKQEKLLPSLNEKLADLSDAASVYEDEYAARGGWSRFYQVTNSNGHVHSSTRCSTCFPTTQFYWHADRSGMSDDDIVDLAGSDACTVCFSDAPVEKLSQVGQLETPDMKTKREEREAREAKRAAKALDDAAKGITTPSGAPLRGQHGVLKTERAAEQELVNELLWLYQYDSKNPDNPYIPKYKESAQRIFEALLAKRGGDREANISLIKEKAVAKIKREWKESLPYFEQHFDPDLLR